MKLVRVACLCLLMIATPLAAGGGEGTVCLRSLPVECATGKTFQDGVSLCTVYSDGIYRCWWSYTMSVEVRGFGICGDLFVGGNGGSVEDVCAGLTGTGSAAFPSGQYDLPPPGGHTARRTNNVCVQPTLTALGETCRNFDMTWWIPR